MNLREQLKEILPEILPESPSDCIKGTKLIELVKFRLKQDYSEATLRYHFSIMSSDPSAPIAKVEHGQGYYLRPTAAQARNLISAGAQQAELLQTPGGDRAIDRAKKFQAIFLRLHEIAGRFPFTFENSFPEGKAFENLWKYPDAVILGWEAGTTLVDGIELDQGMIDLKRTLGGAPFSLTSVKMRLEVNYANFREFFFQCVSNSTWAHRAEIAISANIDDELLIDDLRRLGNRFGVGVTTYGLSMKALDELPSPEDILDLDSRGIEAIEERVRISRLSTSTTRAAIDWEHLAEAREANPDFQELFRWINHCLGKRKAHSHTQFSKPKAKEKAKARGKAN